MIPRDRHLRTLTGLLRRHRVVAIIGARQVGKTTLAQQLIETWKGQTASFDLEDESDLARLADPMLALRSLRGLVVLDEVQHVPDLFKVLRVLADRPRGGARFMVLGSASPGLLKQSSESLAGRVHYHELTGFTMEEVGAAGLTRLWSRGGFPRSFLARSNPRSMEWRRDFVRTYLERDIPSLGIGIPAATVRRFWTMLAHYHGQVWNASEFGRALAVSNVTVGRYLDLLSGTYVVRVLRPFFVNLKKRQVKAPKVYIADSGLLHALLGLETLRDLEGHPKVGASWEGFGIEQVIQRLGADPDECHFWATHAGAELDLLVVRGNQRRGFEFKRTVAPRITSSMRIAMSDLGLTSIDVVHAGDETFPLAERIRALAMTRLIDDLRPL